MTQNPHNASSADLPPDATREEVARLRLELELERVERHWREARDKYMVYGRYGVRYKPSPWRAGTAGGVSVFVGIFGLASALTSRSSKTGVLAAVAISGGFFILLGILVGLFGGIMLHQKQIRYRHAEETYKRERGRILQELGQSVESTK